MDELDTAIESFNRLAGETTNVPKGHRIPRLKELELRRIMVALDRRGLKGKEKNKLGWQIIWKATEGDHDAQVEGLSKHLQKERIPFMLTRGKEFSMFAYAGPNDKQAIKRVYKAGQIVGERSISRLPREDYKKFMSMLRGVDPEKAVDMIGVPEEELRRHVEGMGFPPKSKVWEFLTKPRGRGKRR